MKKIDARTWLEEIEDQINDVKTYIENLETENTAARALLSTISGNEVGENDTTALILACQVAARDWKQFPAEKKRLTEKIAELTRENEKLRGDIGKVTEALGACGPQALAPTQSLDDELNRVLNSYSSLEVETETIREKLTSTQLSLAQTKEALSAAEGDNIRLRTNNERLRKLLRANHDALNALFSIGDWKLRVSPWQDIQEALLGLHRIYSNREVS